MKTMTNPTPRRRHRWYKVHIEMTSVATGRRLNQGYEYRVTLGPEADAQVLLDYLCRRYHHSSPAE
jgi:hypothetical protein